MASRRGGDTPIEIAQSSLKRSFYIPFLFALAYSIVWPLWNVPGTAIASHERASSAPITDFVLLSTPTGERTHPFHGVLSLPLFCFFAAAVRFSLYKTHHYLLSHTHTPFSFCLFRSLAHRSSTCTCTHIKAPANIQISTSVRILWSTKQLLCSIYILFIPSPIS